MELSISKEFGIPHREILNAYEKTTRMKKTTMICLVIVITLFSLYAVTIGPVNITVFDVIKSVLHRLFSELVNMPDPAVDVVVWQVRIPRILTALVVGFGLAISGAVMQPVLRNPMASPFTLGISSGAGFGAAVAIVFGKSIGGGSFHIVANAFAFSLLSAFLILLLSKKKGITPEMMILIGIALSYLFTACTTIIQYFADSWATEEIVFWMVGSLSKGTWDSLQYICPVLLICIPYLIVKAWDLNSISAGDDAAKSMGVNVDRSRIILMMIASLTTSTIICFTGAIGFVGLVAPHITRLIDGGDNRYVVPTAGLVGALLMLTSDIVAMNIIKPVILPIGVVTSLMGVPMFVALIVRMKRGNW